MIKAVFEINEMSKKRKNRYEKFFNRCRTFPSRTWVCSSRLNIMSVPFFNRYMMRTRRSVSYYILRRKHKVTFHFLFFNGGQDAKRVHTINSSAEPRSDLDRAVVKDECKLLQRVFSLQWCTIVHRNYFHSSWFHKRVSSSKSLAPRFFCADSEYMRELIFSSAFWNKYLIITR